MREQERKGERWGGEGERRRGGGRGRGRGGERGSIRSVRELDLSALISVKNQSAALINPCKC